MTIHTTFPPGPQRATMAALAHLAATNTPPGACDPLRAALEAHIEACLALLDAIDGDPDLEPDLGALGGTSLAQFFDQTQWADGEDAEDDGDLEDGADREPDLGAAAGDGNQESWGQGAADDHEIGALDFRLPHHADLLRGGAKRFALGAPMQGAKVCSIGAGRYPAKRHAVGVCS